MVNAAVELTVLGAVSWWVLLHAPLMALTSSLWDEGPMNVLATAMRFSCSNHDAARSMYVALSVIELLERGPMSLVAPLIACVTATDGWVALD